MLAPAPDDVSKSTFFISIVRHRSAHFGIDFKNYKNCTLVAQCESAFSMQIPTDLPRVRGFMTAFCLAESIRSSNGLKTNKFRVLRTEIAIAQKFALRHVIPVRQRLVPGESIFRY